MKYLEKKIKQIDQMHIEKIDINKTIYIILSAISLLYLTTKVVEHNISKGIILMILLTYILFNIGFYFILKKLLKNNLKLEKIFLLFSIIFGVLYLFGFPPSQIPDESSDYLRALEISQFHLTTPQDGTKVGGKFSTNISKIYSIKKYKDVIKYKDLKLNKNTKLYAYANKSLYAFVCYIPQALGLLIANLFNLPIIIQILFGKAFNYLFYVLLIYYSIKYIPYKKELILFISLLPMSLQEAVSLSPDAMIISTLIALASFILYQKENQKAVMNRKSKIFLGILVMLIALCKIIYVPLVFLIYLIPEKRFHSKKEKLIYCSMICFLAIIVNLYWLSISSKYLVAFYGKSNSSIQLKFIMNNPLSYIIILFRTIDNYTLMYLEELVGSSLGPFIIETSKLIVCSSILFLLLLIVGNNRKGKTILKLSEKIYLSILLIGTLLLMFTSLYLQWTGYKENWVDGIQGRYFIPMIPILSMLFMKEKEITYGKKIIYFIWFMDIMSIIAIYLTFI